MKTIPTIRSLQIHLTGVDIDSEMLRIGKTWFGLDDRQSTCVVDDGLKYLQQQLQEKSKPLSSFLPFSSPRMLISL